MTRTRVLRLLVVAFLPKRIQARLRLRRWKSKRRVRLFLQEVRRMARDAAVDAIAPHVATLKTASEMVLAADAARRADAEEVARLVEGLNK